MSNRSSSLFTLIENVSLLKNFNKSWVVVKVWRVIRRLRSLDTGYKRRGIVHGACDVRGFCLLIKLFY